VILDFTNVDLAPPQTPRAGFGLVRGVHWSRIGTELGPDPKLAAAYARTIPATYNTPLVVECGPAESYLYGTAYDGTTRIRTLPYLRAMADTIDAMRQVNANLTISIFHTVQCTENAARFPHEAKWGDALREADDAIRRNIPTDFGVHNLYISKGGEPAIESIVALSAEMARGRGTRTYGILCPYWIDTDPRVSVGATARGRMLQAMKNQRMTAISWSDQPAMLAALTPVDRTYAGV